MHTFHGNFFVRSTDLLSLANINPDAGFAVQLSIEESLADTSLVCFQTALLYTSSKGNASSTGTAVSSFLFPLLVEGAECCSLTALAFVVSDRVLFVSLLNSHLNP